MDHFMDNFFIHLLDVSQDKTKSVKHFYLVYLVLSAKVRMLWGQTCKDFGGLFYQIEPW